MYQTLFKPKRLTRTLRAVRRGEERPRDHFRPIFGIFLGGLKVLMCMTVAVIELLPDKRLNECRD